LNAALLALAMLGQGDEPEGKAVAFLAVEVPKWSREHRCFSCHNNGDAARALYRARASGLGFDGKALDSTTDWLERPEAWDRNGPEGPSSDKRLARIEFALALATAFETGRTEALVPLRRAAARVAAEQGGEGSWPVEDGGGAGSPATYGRPLASAMAVRVLRTADEALYAKPIARAVEWMRAERVADVPTAAASLLIERLDPGPENRPATVARGLDFLRKAQARDGGWGPHIDSPTEPFDTALALIALAPFRSDAAVADSVSRGRNALIAMQVDDGSWPETTRPPGGQSYAQRISTTGWATLALLASRPAIGPGK
jgi:hypothetical protein